MNLSFDQMKDLRESIMTYLPWDDAYSIGFKQIDDGHKILLSFINELYIAYNKGLFSATISGSLAHLAEYTEYHFSIEKKLFTQYKYPNAAKHIEEHNYFTDKLKELQREQIKGSPLISLKKMDFLKDWTISHILGADKEFCEYVKKHKH
jgi:hemerythrin-like metal-binding protein